MADDTASLGFDIDTSGLVKGKLDIAGFVQAAQQMGTMLNQLGTQSAGMSQNLQGLAQQFFQIGQGLGQGGGAGGVVGGLNGLTGALARVAPGLSGVTGALVGAGAAVTGLAAALGGLVLATYKTQEQFLLLEARLKNVFGSMQVAKQVFADLTDMANKNGIAVQTAAEGFLRLARNNEAIGLTRDQLLELTDAVQMLGRVSNASQGELQGGLMQFSQALAAGRLNGDELRSIMENLPALAKAIADGLGVSVGQLRAMGAEGALTADKITKALLGQIPEIQKEFDALPETSETAFARVGNSWDRLVARMGEVLNASGIVTGFGNALAAVLDVSYDTITPDSPEQRLAQLRRERQKVLDSMAAESKNPNVAGFVDRLDQAALLETQDEYVALRNRERVMEAAAAREGRLTADTAAVGRAANVGAEIDKLAKQRKEIETQIQTMREGMAAAARLGANVPEEQRKAVANFEAQLKALEAQLGRIKSPLEDYVATTAKMGENLARYGAGGAASIGEEASKLLEAMQKANPSQNVTFSDAEAAVLARRTTDLRAQTEAMSLQVEEQRRLTDAVGQGTQANIEAEVATKALNLQMQLFGKDLTPEAARQMDQYKAGLRELLQVQRDLTNAQREANAQQEIAIEQALLAAQRNGANAGELREIERQLRLIQTLQQEGATVGVGGGPRIGAGPANVPAGYQGYFDAASKATGIPVEVLASIAKVESGFNPNAVSPTGAMGIMQILPSTARNPGYGMMGLDPSLMTDPGTNIMFGAQYFAARAKSAGLDINNPADLQKALRLYSGADTAMGDKAYDSKVISVLNGGGNSGVTAALADAQLGSLRTTREEEARLLDLRRQRAALDEEIAANSQSEAIAAQRRAEAERYAADFSPERQQEAYAAKIAEFAKQDEAAAAKRRRALDDDIAMAEEKLKIARLSGREYQIELRVLEEINAAKQQGLAYDEAAIRAKITQQVNLEYDEAETRKNAEKFTGVWNEAAASIGSALENAMSQALMNGKVDAEQILKGLVADITMAIFRAYITKPLVEGISGLIGSADGNVFSGGQRMAFASGGVVTSPTLFPMARGAGLMGEAGPEAIMPLKRGADGKLGVAAGGGTGGTQIVINDMRSSPGAEPVETQESTGPDGQRMIQIMVRDEVRRQVRNGDLDREMRGSYGVTRQLTKR